MVHRTTQISQSQPPLTTKGSGDLGSISSREDPTPIGDAGCPWEWPPTDVTPRDITLEGLPPPSPAGSGDIVHRPDYTPNHQRSQLGTLPRRIVGVSMTNGTRHDPCIPRHWAMRCPAWTLTRTSHNRVVNKIRPDTDVASISSVLHLVWPLAQSLSSMVVPTRSQNSSWHSLWDLRGTQAPQLRQSNNTLGGTLPQKGSLPLWHTAHQATPWSPTLTPHRDAFLHHLWGGVAQYRVWEEPRQTKVRN